MWFAHIHWWSFFDVISSKNQIPDALPWSFYYQPKPCTVDGKPLKTTIDLLLVWSSKYGQFNDPCAWTCWEDFSESTWTILFTGSHPQPSMFTSFTNITHLSVSPPSHSSIYWYSVEWISPVPHGPPNQKESRDKYFSNNQRLQISKLIKLGYPFWNGLGSLLQHLSTPVIEEVWSRTSRNWELVWGAKISIHKGCTLR